jgi:hypothetical protein
MEELTLEQLLTAMKRRQPLPPEIRQDIIEGASKVGSFLWEGSGPGIAMNMAKMRMDNPDLSLSDVFPAVVGAGVLRGGGRFRPRVVQGGFSNLDDAQKFALTAERQRVRKQTLSEIFEARKAKEAQLGEIRRSTKPSTLRKPTREQLSELPKEEQDRILKAFDEGKIEVLTQSGPAGELKLTKSGRLTKQSSRKLSARTLKPVLSDEANSRLNKMIEETGILPITTSGPKSFTMEIGGSKKTFDRSNLGEAEAFVNRALDRMKVSRVKGIPITKQARELSSVIGRKKGPLSGDLLALNKAGFQLRKVGEKRMEILKQDKVVGHLERETIKREKRITFIDKAGNRRETHGNMNFLTDLLLALK